ncbi:hypothetical protein TNCV_2879531 [Trichonephila clavipes]|uniref:Uncharacterized protein n=1 Tax=Trichonephila clavipes TaxID=2585209 RepID=A0A8X7BCB6_TRICX|nr:hypothetical protein TNCV_2879531 [Trichonephila clavipes]
MRGCETPGLIIFIGLLLETAADEVSITDAGVHDYLIISSSLGGRYQICRYCTALLHPHTYSSVLVTVQNTPEVHFLIDPSVANVASSESPKPAILHLRPTEPFEVAHSGSIVLRNSLEDMASKILW